MFCPRCGSPVESGDKFCGACGQTLGEPKKKAAESSSQGGRLGRIVGTTPKARLISGATALALIAALVAFLALKPTDEGVPRDAYTVAADHMCVAAKRQIVAASRGGGGALALSIVPIVANWRAKFNRLRAPADRREDSAQLDTALREVEIEGAVLARMTEREDRAGAIASAKRTDEATGEVESAISTLGLTECAAATIGFSKEAAE